MRTFFFGIAQDAFGLAAGRDGFELFEKPAAYRDDAAIAGAKMLGRPVRDHTLPHPGQKILVHHMGVDPLSVSILD